VGSCSKELLVCVKGKSCSKNASDNVWKALKKAISKFGLGDFYSIKKAECFGLCKYSPVIVVDTDDCNYGRVKADDCKKIIKRHAKKKKPLKRLVIDSKKKH